MTRLHSVLTLLLLPLLAAPTRAAEPVSFRHEVMAVLSRAGCNSGACHGNLNGKGGFKLSLRGQDPDLDLLTLTRDALGRRLDPLHPRDSLLLAKATTTVPHEGGQRFAPDSPEYRILLNWITSGAPRDPDTSPSLRRLDVTPNEKIVFEPFTTPVQLRVSATFSDGTTRDVTRLTVFEPSNLVIRVSPTGAVISQGTGESAVLVRYGELQTVARLAFMPAHPGLIWPELPTTNYIDKLVFDRLHALRVRPSPLASDQVFLRRVYLDTIGLPPTTAETRRFLADTRPDRRQRLIDELLARSEFADFWALKWSDLLRNEEKALDTHGVALFHSWLRRAIIDEMPLNEMARKLVAGRGSTYAHPEANYYRALRDPFTRSEATAQVFLGLRLQCAKCHNHPFDRWTQTDYHTFAAFFSRIDYRILKNERRDRLDKHEFAGEQVVFQNRTGDQKDPVTGDVLVPRFLNGGPLPAETDRLDALADWIARSDNPFFARAQANRIWAHLMGRGIVDPVDDFRASNPPSNGPLLDALARDLADHRFNLKHLVRTILNSRTYQLTAQPDDTNRDDETHFARAIVRPLQAEVLHDALAQAVGVTPRFAGMPVGTRAVQLPGVGANRRGPRADGERFLAAFGKPVRSLSCECERSEDSTLAQAFALITGSVVHDMIADPDNRIHSLMKRKCPTSEMVEELYLASLCRPPTSEERQKATVLIDGARDRRAALEDLLWALVNAKEFLLRR
jgi:Protein of unknown function (DUF1553)/Protein of unknown function (DUF1549)